jgi:hypothetical protein
MFFAQTETEGNVCVGNCQSVGLYPDATNRICVGCHPACKSCFGPESESCFECSDGFVQVDDYTCDTACYPENSYLVNGTKCMRKQTYLIYYECVFIACQNQCRGCFGGEANQCTECYPPYYLESSSCLFNSTLAAILSEKYTPVIIPW